MKFLALLVMSLLVINGCKEEALIDEGSTDGSAVTKRMPFYQYTYYLDYENGKSYVYQVDYDFQGLTGKAELEPIVCVDGAAHLTVSPSTLSDPQRYLVIVNNGVSAHKVYVVPVTGGEIVGLDDSKYLAPEYGFDIVYPDGASDDKKITQVDFDQENHLFVAGTAGFYEIFYGDKETGTFKGYDITKASLTEDNLYVISYNIFSNTSGVITTALEEDGLYTADDYVNTGVELENPVFSGGDILFTQNSDETNNMESELLISFTQWGDMAMLVDFELNTESVTANHLFTLRKSMDKYAASSAGDGENITGAALIGDNLLMTSHHASSTFSVWNLHGEEVASPAIEYPASVPSGWYIPTDGAHNWGDMASFQRFDHTTFKDMSISEGKIIAPETEKDAEYAEVWWPYYYATSLSSHQDKMLAEAKLYIPNKSGIENYDVNDDDNPVVDGIARENSANADIADLRANSLKFVALGCEGGMLMMKFPEAYPVTSNTKLQIVETSHSKLAQYIDENGLIDLGTAWEAYSEEAFIYVSDNPAKYIGSWKDNDSAWTLVGIAGIANNIFEIPEGLTSINWVKIVDNGSTTFDGFDVNFVAAFNMVED